MVWEMLKPKRSGYSDRRRFRWVDLPEPEGPEMTIGRGVCAVRGREVSFVCRVARGRRAL